MTPMFIDFRGHIIKIIDKDGKATAVMSNEEELAQNAAEAILLDSDPEELTDNVYNKTINKVFDDIKGEWEADLKKNVMRILGFSDSWRKWEVDHCNGRMSEIGHLIGDEVKKIMLSQVDPAKLKLTKEELKQFSSAVKEDLVKRFNYQYGRAFQSAMEKLVEEAAKNEAKAQFDKLIKDKKGDGLEVIRLLNYKLNNPRN